MRSLSVYADNCTSSALERAKLLRVGELEAEGPAGRVGVLLAARGCHRSACRS